MSKLVQIDDLHRPVTQEEYIIVVSKTAISVELLYRTTEQGAADLILHSLLTGMAYRLNKDLGTFVNDVRVTSRGMKNMGFFDSKGFQELVQQTLAQGEPDEEAAEEFFEYVVNEAPVVASNLPPAGTTIN